MDILAAAATPMDSEVTLAPAAAPHSPVATTIARMEAAAPAEAKRAATGGGREAKPKASKKVLSAEEKIVEAVKRRGPRKNQKIKTAAAANHQAWQISKPASRKLPSIRP